MAAVHATTEDAAGTDWAAMVSLYDELLRLGPSPVVALNRAIAVGMSDGPLAGLAALDDLADEPKLAAYHLLPAARADLLARGGLTAEAVVALDDAITLAPTAQDRRQLARRRDELAGEIERGDVKEESNRSSQLSTHGGRAPAAFLVHRLHPGDRYRMALCYQVGVQPLRCRHLLDPRVALAKQSRRCGR